MQKGMGQLRVAPSGKIIGLDIPALLMIADAIGYHLKTFMELLPYAESGLLKAIREQYGSSD